MANEKNLKGHGFDKRSTEEVREIARRGGKKSGETRRKKAEFKKVLNALLTAEVENEEWEPTLKAMGLDCTLETIINARMILEAMQGNVKAYEAIAKYSGQDARTEAEIEKEKAEIEKEKADQAGGAAEIKIVMEGEDSE